MQSWQSVWAHCSSRSVALPDLRLSLPLPLFHPHIPLSRSSLLAFSFFLSLSPSLVTLLLSSLRLPPNLSIAGSLSLFADSTGARTCSESLNPAPALQACVGIAMFKHTLSPTANARHGIDKAGTISGKDAAAPSSTLAERSGPQLDYRTSQEAFDTATERRFLRLSDVLDRAWPPEAGACPSCLSHVRGCCPSASALCVVSVAEELCRVARR